MLLHRFPVSRTTRSGTTRSGTSCATSTRRAFGRACHLSATCARHDALRHATDHGGPWCPATVDLPPRPVRAHPRRIHLPPGHGARRDARL